jgi:hypothetical protein
MYGHKLFLGLLHYDTAVKLLQVQPPYANLKPPTETWVKETRNSETPRL